MFQTKVVEKKQICFFHFFPENFGVYELMWKYIVKPERPQMKIHYDACALDAG